MNSKVLYLIIGVAIGAFVYPQVRGRLAAAGV